MAKRKLTIIRGIPGSGKSTLAEKMTSEDPNLNTLIVEADHYWLRPDGQYDFNIRFIGEAHEWCFNRVFKLLTKPYYFDVILSNTSTVWKEVKKYVEKCKDLDYDYEIITLTENYGNIHDVPETTLAKMAARFESHEDILKKCEEV